MFKFILGIALFSNLALAETLVSVVIRRNYEGYPYVSTVKSVQCSYPRPCSNGRMQFFLEAASESIQEQIDQAIESKLPVTLEGRLGPNLGEVNGWLQYDLHVTKVR